MADPSPSIASTANAATGSNLGGPLDIKKRARRRLVGAIALVLLAVIVLPMVMDQEPKPITQDIQIHIPSQEPGTGSFISRIKPAAPAPAPTPLPAEPPAPPPAAPVTAATGDAEPRPAAPTVTPAKPETKPEVKPESSRPTASAAASPSASATPPTAIEKPAETKPPAKPTEKTTPVQNADSVRATALLNDERWVVQLGAYQDQANVKLLQGKIKELGYPIFTEKIDTSQGPRIRVRCGPFPSREAAEKAQVRLKKISAGGPTGGVVAQMQ